MAAYHEWKCEKCGWEVRTSHSHEFYIDKNGQRKGYGHPSPHSKEAEEQGVKGLLIYGYCPKCDKVTEAVVREFDKPLYEGWWHTKGQEKEPVCETCGTQLVESFMDKPCPKCGYIFRGLDIPVFS